MDLSALQGKWQREKRASLILAYSIVALVAAGQRLASMPGSRFRREERFRRAGGVRWAGALTAMTSFVMWKMKKIREQVRAM